MPVYEYICSGKKCQHVFTELARFEDIFKCPRCKKKADKQMATTHHPVFILNKTRFRRKRRTL